MDEGDGGAGGGVEEVGEEAEVVAVELCPIMCPPNPPPSAGRPLKVQRTRSSIPSRGYLMESQ